ncbi:MAG: sigma-70 family RNA polymerase sigma factor [Planctomycetes bacterium]|nr:sigma-70 family RNA polymerase sigma factor [Planctomycetota bacterium]
MAERGERDLQETVVLVDAAKRGDRSAAEELFARYLPRVRQIVALRTGQRLRRLVEVDDITQQVLLRALEGLERFEHRTEGSFLSWLADCVACEITALARRFGARKRGGGWHREPLLSSLLADRGARPSQLAEAAETEEQIEEALHALPGHYREVIVLRQLCGMSYAEIAAAMGFRQEANARKAYSRAVQKLEAMLPGK